MGIVSAQKRALFVKLATAIGDRMRIDEHPSPERGWSNDTFFHNFDSTHECAFGFAEDIGIGRSFENNGTMHLCHRQDVRRILDMVPVTALLLARSMYVLFSLNGYGSHFSISTGKTAFSVKAEHVPILDAFAANGYASQQKGHSYIWTPKIAPLMWATGGWLPFDYEETKDVEARIIDRIETTDLFGKTVRALDNKKTPRQDYKLELNARAHEAINEGNVHHALTWSLLDKYGYGQWFIADNYIDHYKEYDFEDIGWDPFKTLMFEFVPKFFAERYPQYGDGT